MLKSLNKTRIKKCYDSPSMIYDRYHIIQKNSFSSARLLYIHQDQVMQKYRNKYQCSWSRSPIRPSCWLLTCSISTCHHHRLKHTFLFVQKRKRKKQLSSKKVLYICSFNVFLIKIISISNMKSVTFSGRKDYFSSFCTGK